MSGVGSTNAMKKGSANNPFLAFSEADMKGYLNSAYTGCIVKYTGDPIARKISDVNKTVPDNAQNLVFNRSKGSPASNWGCFKITTKSGDTETVQYLRTLFYNYRTKEITWETQHSSGWVVFLAICNNQHPTSVLDLLGIKILWVPGSYESNSDDYPGYWPVTLGWQGENVDADGKVTLWGYGENVSFVYLEDGKDIYITYNDIPCVVTPYIVGELYKVVYVDNEYRYEEFHYISEDKTTAGAEDVAPGKTFYDFAGTKQIGTGTRANPFLARGDSDMSAFNNATYLGKFIKYIGKTNDTYVKDAIYQVTNDATEYDRYMLLPTLENEAQPSELSEGKQLISSLGAVVVGTGNIVLKAATTEGMQALFTEANVGKLVQYLGDSDVYIKDAIYQIVDTSVAKQYYELPVLTSEGTADDLAIGKELINSKGVKIIGTMINNSIKSQTFNIQRTTNEIFNTIKELSAKMLYATIKNSSLNVTVKNVSFDTFADRICFFNISAPRYYARNNDYKDSTTIIDSYTFANNVGWAISKTTISTTYTSTSVKSFTESPCEVIIYYVE